MSVTRRGGTGATWWTTPDLLLGIALAVAGPPFAIVFQPTGWVVILVFVIFAALIPIVAMRRTRPPICILGGAVAIVLLVAVTPAISLHVAFVVGIITYTAASQLSTRLTWATFGFVTVVIVATIITRPHAPAPIIGALFSLSIAAVSALTGLLNRRERERAEQFLVLKRSEERAAVARELHDVVAHSLGVIAVQAEGARYAGTRDIDVTQKALVQIATIARGSLRRARGMVVALRSENDKLFLGMDGFDQIAEIIQNARAAGFTVSVTLPEAWPKADLMIQTTVNRIVTEGFSNAMRHSSGPISLEMRDQEATMLIEVCNPYSGPSKSAGIGLTGLQERAQLAGGHLMSTPDPTRNVWRLVAEVPLR